MVDATTNSQPLGFALFFKLTPATRFGFCFLLTCAVLFSALEIAPEGFYHTVNRLNALLAGLLLSLWGMPLEVRGVVIVLDGFSAQVIGECSAIFISVLPFAFIFAYPSNWRQKIVGWILGIFILFSINLIRIAVLVYTGSRNPDQFQLVHLYLGQTAIVLTVLAICIGWTRWSKGSLATLFISWRFALSILISLPLFAIMWWLSTSYTQSLYLILQWTFSWFDTVITIPEKAEGYSELFYCFNMVTYSALFWGFSARRDFKQGVVWLYGIVAMAFMHLIFKLLQILFFQFSMHGLMVVINTVLQINLWILPFGLWLLMERFVDYK